MKIQFAAVAISAIIAAPPLTAATPAAGSDVCNDAIVQIQVTRGDTTSGSSAADAGEILTRINVPLAGEGTRIPFESGQRITYVAEVTERGGKTIVEPSSVFVGSKGYATCRNGRISAQVGNYRLTKIRHVAVGTASATAIELPEVQVTELPLTVRNAKGEHHVVAGGDVTVSVEVL